MRIHIARARNFFGIALVAAAGGCGILSNDLVERQDTINVAHVAGKPLKVETENGAITVVKADRPDVQIFAHIRAQSKDRLAAVKIINDREQDQTLSIHVDWPGGTPLSNESCDFDILLPDSQGITLASSNGKIQATGLAGPADLRTSNGEIVIEYHTGTVDAHTSNGAVTVKGATDSVTANSSNGAIEIAFSPQAVGPVEVHNSNGAVTLSVGPAFAGEMTLETTNGAVVVDSSTPARKVESNLQHAKLVFAPGKQKSVVTTTNGAIRVAAASNE